MSTDGNTHGPARSGVLLVLLLAGCAMAVAVLAPWHASVQVRLATGIVLLTLVLWISEIAPLGVIALSIPVAAMFTGLLSWSEALSAWGDPIVFLFLGAFLLARSLDKFGVFDVLLDSGWVRRQRATVGWQLTLGVMLLAGALSCMQNNTAVTAILLPAVVALARRSRAPAFVLLGLAYGATFGGLATPVGTAPNAIGFARASAEGVTFLGWMTVGVPAWLGLTLIAWLTFGVLYRIAPLRRLAERPAGSSAFDALPDVGPPRPEHEGAHAGSEFDPAARRNGQRWAVAGFLAVMTVWVGSGVVAGLASPDSALREAVLRYVPVSLPPLTAALLLFVVRIDRRGRTVLDRRDFQAIDWDTLFLIAGGLCLGKVLDSSGAAGELARSVAQGGLPPTALLLALGAVTVLLSELTSNTATASLMVPIAASLAGEIGLPVAQAVWFVALAASLGFALPISTPPNALVYGTRLVPLRLMIAAGVTVDVLGLCWLTLCMRMFG